MKQPADIAIDFTSTPISTDEAIARFTSAVEQIVNQDQDAQFIISFTALIQTAKQK